MEPYYHLIEKAGMVVFLLGLLVSSAVTVSLVWRSFRESLLWGLACIILPLALFLFILRFWKENRLMGSWYFGSVLVMFAGLAMVWSSPDFRAVAKAAYERKRVRWSDVRSFGESMEAEKERPSKGLQKMQEEFEKLERERNIVLEKRQRATELFAFVQNWREELLLRKPGESASEAEKERFRLEHANYTGLLEEYKQAAEGVKKAEAALLNPPPAPPEEVVAKSGQSEQSEPSDPSAPPETPQAPELKPTSAPAP